MREWYDAGGALMLPILGTGVVVLAAILDRLLYAAGRARRRPLAEVRRFMDAGRLAEARHELALERSRAARRTARIDAVSQLATSLGLYGTVVGIAQAFFARGGELSSAAPEVLATGLSTALFTTIGGLIVFLGGQTFLIAWQEWQTFLEREIERGLASASLASAEAAP